MMLFFTELVDWIESLMYGGTASRKRRGPSLDEPEDILPRHRGRM